MKAFLLAATTLMASGLFTAVHAQAAPAPAAPPTAAPLPDSLKDPRAQESYAIGLSIGGSMKRDGLDVDPALVAQGIRDVLSGAKPLMSPDQVKATMTQLQQNMVARRQEAAAKAAAANKADGEAFLKANAAKPGVVTLPSGLQYEVLKAGTGPIPKSDDTVSCNYRGTLINGEEFDSSYKRGEPSSFPVDGVIKGWTEALQKMPVGSKWRLVVPSGLAYGEKGAGPQIGPDSVLIFEIELLAIEPKS